MPATDPMTAYLGKSMALASQTNGYKWGPRSPMAEIVSGFRLWSLMTGRTEYVSGKPPAPGH